MEKRTPVPDEEKVKIDPQSGEIEPAPIDMEGARVMANEASDELGCDRPEEKQAVRKAAEEYVTERGTDDTENFEAHLTEGTPRDD